MPTSAKGLLILMAVGLFSLSLNPVSRILGLDSSAFLAGSLLLAIAVVILEYGISETTAIVSLILAAAMVVIQGAIH
jgi:ABC-type transport system involved in multi-copper enzyme maturation permease subunit